jgi:hypothetical protein
LRTRQFAAFYLADHAQLDPLCACTATQAQRAAEFILGRNEMW